MKTVAAAILLTSLLGALAPNARATDADDVTKLAHDLLIDLAWVDYDKIAAIGRPQDADAFKKPPEEVVSQFRELQSLPQVQDLRRQLADEVPKAASLDAPAFTPDNTCAIVNMTPVKPELRKFCELMTIYLTYVTTAQQDKAQKLPMPTVEAIRAQVLAPGSPYQQGIDQQVASLPSHKLRLQFEKTKSGWRVNLRAFEAAIDMNPPDSP